jgi:23S rRNA maturation mini-RNase III
MHVAMQKLFMKKEKKKRVLKKMDKLYFDARLKKEMMNKIAHFSCKVFFKFQKRGMFSRSIVELGLATIYTYHVSTIFHTHSQLDLIV